MPLYGPGAPANQLPILKVTSTDAQALVRNSMADGRPLLTVRVNFLQLADPKATLTTSLYLLMPRRTLSPPRHASLCYLQFQGRLWKILFL